jgi:AcrR family transcriptional regulator
MRSEVVRSPRKPKGQGSERRQEILDAALVLFTQRGVLGVTTRDIAAAVGLSQPAIYAHFRNRDEITAEVCEQAFRQLKGRIEALPADEVASRYGFFRMCRTYIDFGLEQPDAYRIAFMLEKAQPQSEPTDARILAAGIDVYEEFRDWVAQLVAAGLTRPGEISLLTQALWAGLHGLTSLLIARPLFPWVNPETLITRHLEILADGILRPEGVTPRR